MVGKGFKWKLSDEMWDKVQKIYYEKYNPNHELCGAIGGGVSFLLTPTSIGTFASAIMPDGAEIDITDDV